MLVPLRHAIARGVRVPLMNQVRQKSLWEELKHRNVVRVGAAYVVIAWLLLQAADILLGNFGAPDWVFKSITVILLLGLPLALVLAWAYELTPDGVKRASEVDDTAPEKPAGYKRLDGLILAGIVVVVAFMVADRWLDRATEAEIDEVEEMATAPPGSAAHVVTDRSIAVLPFADLSPGRDQEYFADGIAEELLNALSRLRDLRTAGRSSSFYLHERGESLRAIGEALGVAYILEGSVRKSADRVRITAQLISAADGFQLWSETYDGDLGDIFELQERIARAITSELRVVLSGAQQERIVERATHDSEAYSLFLQATAIFNRRDRDRLVEAAEMLEEALDIDPEFTRARSRLAAVLVVTPAYAPVDQETYFTAAELQARRAIAEDDRAAEPHAVLGLLLSAGRQFLPAHTEFQRALELDPNDVTSHFWFGIHLWMTGYRIPAAEHLDRVLAIDPILPNGMFWRGMVYLDQGDLQRAGRMFGRAYGLGLTSAATGLALLAALQGETERAIRHYSEAIGQAFTSPGGEDVDAVFADGVFGNEAARTEALSLIEQYLAAEPGRIHGIVPQVLMKMSRPDEALELAARAPLINETLFFLVLWVQPFGDAARQSPFFPEFASRTGLAEYWAEYGTPERCRRRAELDYVCN